MRSNCSTTEDTNTATQLSITFELQDSGACILTKRSRLTRSQSVLSSPRSRALKLRQTTRTVTSTSVRTLQSLDKLHQLTGLTLTVIKAKQGQWCDYCKMRVGNEQKTFKGEGTLPRQAVWTVVSQHAKSNGINRHYCQPCAVWVSAWPDKSHWPLTEQAEFLVKEEEIDFVTGELK